MSRGKKTRTVKNCTTCGNAKDESGIKDICQKLNPRGCEIKRDWVPRSKIEVEREFIVFVDGMDGDVYRGVSATGHAVEHALVHGAKDIKIRRWKR